MPRMWLCTASRRQEGPKVHFAVYMMLMHLRSAPKVVRWCCVLLRVCVCLCVRATYIQSSTPHAHTTCSITRDGTRDIMSRRQIGLFCNLIMPCSTRRRLRRPAVDRIAETYSYAVYPYMYSILSVAVRFVNSLRGRSNTDGIQFGSHCSTRAASLFCRD